MKFLTLDTSTAFTVVALGDESGLVTGVRRRFKKGRSEELVRLLAGCLDKAGWTTGDIDVFGVGTGPGSFTGLRIGLSTIKGLSFATGKPCVAFSSLEAIAAQEFPKDTPHPEIVVDARRGNVYVRRNKRDRMTAYADFAGALKAGASLAGDGLKVYGGAIERDHPGVSLLPEKYWYPTPRALAALTVAALKKKKTTDGSGLLPVYFYKADCQVRK